MEIQVLWYVLAAVLIVAGLIGTVLPAIPGVPLVFAGMLLASWADGFQHAGLWTLITLGVLTVIAVAVDFFAGLAGAKRVGASKLALFGAAVGTIVGIFFGIPGLLLGPFAAHCSASSSPAALCGGRAKSVSAHGSGF